MAFEIKKYEKLLLMMVIVIPIITSTNIDCNGKSFHCVNSTHFMICVDLGGGVSTTVDNFVIPCPPPTACKRTNYFECEIPISSTLAPTGQPFMAPLEKISTTQEWEQISTTSRNTGAEQHLELSTVQPRTVVTESSFVSDTVPIYGDPLTITENNFTIENITEPITWKHGLSAADDINEVIIGNTTTTVANDTTWENLANNDLNNHTSTSSIIEIVTGQTTINFTELITDATESNNYPETNFYTREPVWTINGNEYVSKLNDNGNFLLNESTKNKAESVDIASITTIENVNLQTNKIQVTATEKSPNHKVSNVTVNSENAFETTTVRSQYAYKSVNETNTSNTTEVDDKVISNTNITGTDFKTISDFPSEIMFKVVTSTESSKSNKISNFSTTEQTITTKTETSNLYVSEISSPIFTSVNVNNTTRSTYDNEDPIYENMKFQDIPKLQSLNENESSGITSTYVSEGNDKRFTTSILNKIDLNNTYISPTVKITENKMNANETGKDTFLFSNETELTTAEKTINPAYNYSIKIPQEPLIVTNISSHVNNFEEKEKDSKVLLGNNSSTLDSKVTIENTSKSVDGSKTEASKNVVTENITGPSNLYVNRTGMVAMGSVNDSINFTPQKEDGTFVLHTKEDNITSLGQDVTTESLFYGSKLTIINNIITIQHNSSNDKVIENNNTISSISSVSSSHTENKTASQGLNQQTLTEAYNKTETPKLNNVIGVAVDCNFTTTTNKILTETSKTYVDTFATYEDNIVKISTKNDAAELSHAELYTTLPTVSASFRNYEKVLTDQTNTVDTNTEISPFLTIFTTPYENISITTPPMLPIQEKNIKSAVVTEAYSSNNIDTKESDATTKFTTIVDSVANTEITSAAVSTVSLSLSIDKNTTEPTDTAITSDFLSLYSKLNDETQNVMTTEPTFSLKAFKIPETTTNQIMQINESNIMIEDSVQYPILGIDMQLELTTAKSSNINFGDLSNMTSDTQINKLKSSMEPVSILQSRTESNSLLEEATVSTNKTTGAIKNKEESNTTLTTSGVIGIEIISITENNTDMNIIKNTDATAQYTEHFPGITESMSSLFAIAELPKNKTVTNKVTIKNDRTKINKPAINLANPTNSFKNVLLNNTIMPLTSEPKLNGSTDITQEPVTTPTSSDTYNVTSVIREMILNNVPSHFTEVSLSFPSTHDTTEQGKISFEIIPSIESSSVTANSSTNSSNTQNEFNINTTDIAMKNFTDTIFTHTTNIAAADELNLNLPKSHSTSTKTGDVLSNSLPLNELSSVTKNSEIPIIFQNLDESNITIQITNPKSSSATENTLVNHENVSVDTLTSIAQASYDTTTETVDGLSNSLPSIEISLTTEINSTLKNKYEINATKGIATIPLSAKDTILPDYSNVEVNKLDFPASHITTTNTSEVLSNKISPVELSFVTETNGILSNSSDKQNLYVNNGTRDIAREISGADGITPVKRINVEIDEPGSILLASFSTTISKGEELSNNTPLIELSFSTKGRSILNNSLNAQNIEVNVTRDDLVLKSSNGVDNTWLNHGIVNNSYYGLPVYQGESTVTGKVFPNVEITSITEVDNVLKNTSDAQTAYYEVNITTNNGTIEVDSRLPAIHYTHTANFIPVDLNFTTESNRILINSSNMQGSDYKVMTKSPISGSDPTSFFVSKFGGKYSYEDSGSHITHDKSTTATSEVFSNDLTSDGIKSSATEGSMIPSDPPNVIITSSSSAYTSIIKPVNINKSLFTTISPNKQDIENITLLPFTKTTRPVVNGNYNKATNPFVISSTTTAYKGQEDIATNKENQYEHASDNNMHSITHFILGQTESLTATLVAKELTTRKGMTPFYPTAAANPTTGTTMKFSTLQQKNSKATETITAPIQYSSPLPQSNPVESNPIQSVFNCKERGRYSDKHDCRKFYICNGSPHVITGLCPFNTVFSEIKKLCTKNLSHCIRENQFHCVSAGRFSDFWKSNVYYICVKSGEGFLRYKLQCQNGYYLNKTTVRCYRYPESSSVSFSYDNSQSTTERKVERKRIKKKNNKKEFMCEKEGKFPYSDDGRKYYVCSKRQKSDEFKVKVKKCDSDEIFHKKKRRCVDASSYERS